MNIIIAFLSCALGIGISLYIYYKKRAHQKLACPREHPCDTIIHSRFSRTFGIPNELLGIKYFSLIAILLLIPASGVATAWLLYVLFFLLLLGALFSIYLLGLQAFVLRAWCAWCLGIAAANIALIISLSSIPLEVFTPILATQRIWWVIVHNIGFVLGLGAATITDVLFFRFLKDHTISLEEKAAMDTLTNVIWAGLTILVVSGVALYLPEAARLSASPKFLLKVIVVSVIVANGILLNMLVAPRLRMLSFDGTLPARRFRRLAFALGGISISSWYLAFLLGSLRRINLPFHLALFAYVGLLVCVIIGSQVAERKLTKYMQRGS